MARRDAYPGLPPSVSGGRLYAALAEPGRPGVRVIAKQFGVDPGTVWRISAGKRPSP